ncbi:alpha-ribazole phosphatase [Paenibacillus shirakamiensis]|uniref:Alpha-ribazole phosphatase n=1 Tax=Paenibacillus shirakamiensis TaxID=1265935 RepID=A0ABS4JFN6_9BACL|nr:histidine phosphatase family protein [Paenibacillus shirakamiensis]MBP2000532.1 alpha-ribazole phosphatase [Paenibacillus shirakamiensis]
MESEAQFEIEWHLVRHGRTQWNVERRYLGHMDIPLLDGGHAGLESLREELASTKFPIVQCSDLQRCRMTLERVRPDLKNIATFDERLREMDFGDWEGFTYEELKDIPRYRQWIDHPADHTPPQGESWTQLERRVLSVLEEIVTRLKIEDAPPEGEAFQVLIVTHGGVIRLLRTVLIPGAHFKDAMVDNGSVLRIRTSHSRAHLGFC